MLFTIQNLSKKTLILLIILASISTLASISGIVYLQISKSSQNYSSQNFPKNCDSRINFVSQTISANISECSKSSQNSSPIIEPFLPNYSAENIKSQEGSQKTKEDGRVEIQEFQKNFKIDFAKNPKPWLLEQQLLDNNNQKIISLSLESKLNYYKQYLKPIATKENKIYLPFWIGIIAIIDTQSGQIAWQDLGMEIRDLSLFNGKYYATTNDCKSTNGIQNCSVFEFDLASLSKRKIYQAKSEVVGATGGAGYCSGHIRQVIFVDASYFYLQNPCFNLQISKYELNGKFIKGYSFAKNPCCGPSQYTDYEYQILEQSVDFFAPEYVARQFSDNFRALVDEKIILEGKIPKNKIETGETGDVGYEINQIKLEKFYKSADDFWQKLFPFETELRKTNKKSGKCGNFVWNFDDKNQQIELKFDNKKVDGFVQNLTCID